MCLFSASWLGGDRVDRVVDHVGVRAALALAASLLGAVVECRRWKECVGCHTAESEPALLRTFEAMGGWREMMMSRRSRLTSRKRNFGFVSVEIVMVFGMGREKIQLMMSGTGIGMHTDQSKLGRVRYIAHSPLRSVSVAQPSPSSAASQLGELAIGE